MSIKRLPHGTHACMSAGLRQVKANTIFRFLVAMCTFKAGIHVYATCAHARRRRDLHRHISYTDINTQQDMMKRLSIEHPRHYSRLPLHMMCAVFKWHPNQIDIFLQFGSMWQQNKQCLWTVFICTKRCKRADVHLTICKQTYIHEHAFTE